MLSLVTGRAGARTLPSGAHPLCEWLGQVSLFFLCRACTCVMVLYHTDSMRNCASLAGENLSVVVGTLIKNGTSKGGRVHIWKISGIFCVCILSSLCP